MIINTTKVEMVLMNKAIPGFTIEAGTGVSRSTISKLRSTKYDTKFKKFSIEAIMKIQKWIDDGNYKFSYDYSSLISEFEADMAEGLLKSTCYIVRGDWLEALEYAPIIDYYYSLDEVDDKDIVIEAKTELILKEMKKWNEVI